MYIIGRMNVNAIAFSLPPLSLSMIQRHDLWFVSVFQDHPSSAGSAAAPPVVNHSESLSLISINRSSVALVSASLNLFFFLPLLPHPPPRCTTYSHAGYQFRSAASSAYLLFNKLTTFSHAMNIKGSALRAGSTYSSFLTAEHLRNVTPLTCRLNEDIAERKYFCCTDFAVALFEQLWRVCSVLLMNIFHTYSHIMFLLLWVKRE